jgi:subtilisin family serine protease
MTPLSKVSNGPQLTPKNNRYIVSLKDRVDEAHDLDFLKEDGFRHLETFDFRPENFPGMEGDLILVELTDEDQSKIAELSQDPRVDFLEPDIEFELQEEPSDGPLDEPSLNDDNSLTRRRPNDLNRRQWGLDNSRGTDIDAPEAWSKTTGSRGPIIAVIDTGVDVNHPDLQANLWVNPREVPNNGRDDDGNGVVDDVHGYDAYHDDGTPEDAHGHGTHCAGIIGATGNNGRGITGVNWQTRIMPIKIFDNSSDKPKSSLSVMLRGVAYAGNNGARLTSNSWGGPAPSQTLERAFSSSRAFHVMGAGNDSQDNDEKPFYPASYRTANSVSVAAVTSGGSLSSFSNFGSSSVDLAAPGSSIYSTLPGGRYGNRSGTSMATPHVTGVAGLLLSLAPGLSNDQLRSLLMRGVVPKRSLQDKTVSGGVVNADRSLELLLRS